ncbi:hypothetical protein FB567DRAFT_546540 [Paraphoma chrysanthemicola]|uniref:Uncharacterized protein n=1 Tax=Paraphoma chrysanthemicola TaxID=798071 RepID=A0A8K0W0E9_9PLEO|nr:hypothetical protein FB567DRAFT_546540 [Paraphoma chrysanthemicola]
MAKNEDFLWLVMVRGDQPAVTQKELWAQVEGTAGCRVILDMSVECAGFIYTMRNDVVENPLIEHIGEGSTADIQVKRLGRALHLKGVDIEEMDQGAEYPFTEEDEGNDILEAA